MAYSENKDLKRKQSRMRLLELYKIAYLLILTRSDMLRVKLSVSLSGDCRRLSCLVEVYCRLQLTEERFRALLTFDKFDNLSDFNPGSLLQNLFACEHCFGIFHPYLLIKIYSFIIFGYSPLVLFSLTRQSTQSDSTRTLFLCSQQEPISIRRLVPFSFFPQALGQCFLYAGKPLLMNYSIGET